MLEIHLKSRLVVKRLARYASLQIMEMGKFQSVELGKVEFRKDDVLPVEPSFQLKEVLSDRINRVFQALVFWHVVHIFENLSKMGPILHEQHACSVNVQYFN